jgi:hypothetical protein
MIQLDGKRKGINDIRVKVNAYSFTLHSCVISPLLETTRDRNLILLDKRDGIRTIETHTHMYVYINEGKLYDGLRSDDAIQ